MIRAFLVSLLIVLAVSSSVFAASPAAELVAEARRALDTDRIDDALALFERAVAADAKDPAALAWLGSAQVRKAGKVPPMDGAGWGDLRAVVAMREKNPQSVPESVMPVIYLNLGRAEKKAGRTAEARATWEQGRRAFPAAPETKAIENELRKL
jgi:tetratricopeptide (TPR) repeat protein